MQVLSNHSPGFVVNANGAQALGPPLKSAESVPLLFEGMLYNGQAMGPAGLKGHDINRNDHHHAHHQGMACPDSFGARVLGTLAG